MRNKKTKGKIGLHPVMALLILAFATIIISGILNFFDVQSTFNKVSTTTGDFQVTSEAVTSLLSLSGLKYIFTTTVSSFANFTVLSNLIIVLLGIGIMVKSGFLKTITTILTKKAKKTTVTFVLVLICILASIMGDLSYIIFIPLSALLFLYGKRNPMIGIITSFAALTCGSALSIFITSIDSSLLTLTLNNANVLQGYSISRFGFIIVMPLLIILLSILITYISENVIAKRLSKYEFPEEEVTEELVLNKKSLRGLTLAAIFGLIYLIIFIYNIIPGLPLSGALLDNSQDLYIDKLFSYNSFFSNGFVFIVAVLFVILGLFYGIGAKTIKNNKEFIDSLGHSLNGIGKILVMIFASATFINIFKQANIGNYVAGALTYIINNSSFIGLPLVILLFIFSIIASVFLPSPLNSWNILSGTVPTLMQASIAPEFALLVFRLGSAVSLGITPVFAYFIVYLAYLENYNQSDKPITLIKAIKYQLPYCLITFILYLIFIIVWYILGFPLGVGTSVAL
jgi:aminobenzoyl-glutamate transport protein